jgi:hypothetical protein
MKKLKIETTAKAMKALESSRLLLEFNWNCAVRPDDAEEILKMLRDKGHCPERKTLSDLAAIAVALTLVDDFLEELARATWDGRFIDGLTFGPDGKAVDEFKDVEVREIELDDGLAEGLIAKAGLLKWSAFESSPDLEWLVNVILEERHNEAHNAVLEYKDLIHSVLRKEGLQVA